MGAPSVRGRIAGRESHLRAADADREQIADQLRTGHTEGRLDLAEFQQRLEHCYEAKTFGELAVLVSDLPRDESDARVPSPRVGPGVRPGWLLAAIGLLFVVMVASAGTWHHGHHPPFFLVFPLLFLIWRMTSHRRARWSGPSRGGAGRWA
ncbi:MAG TPA: DUF1707 domain-containing protein [Solirubrobacteraceae bacterium]|nr:DUF1707 domain-containing protein [Solirubrobacteraceae bacterium]